MRRVYRSVRERISRKTLDYPRDGLSSSMRFAGRGEEMLTIVFLVIFGGLIVGFLVWVLGFGGMKRRGQSGESEVKKEPVKQGRASGLD